MACLLVGARWDESWGRNLRLGLDENVHAWCLEEHMKGCFLYIFRTVWWFVGNVGNVSQYSFFFSLKR